MLGLDQDLEAELGIDSIKRVEILGALVKSLPQNLSAMRKTAQGILLELENSRHHIRQKLEKTNWERAIDSALQHSIQQLPETKSKVALLSPPMLPVSASGASYPPPSATCPALVVGEDIE